jgi:hypothetical protein
MTGRDDGDFKMPSTVLELSATPFKEPTIAQ